eukprot:GFUD01001743.1.p1 GENE.GFUD01001743.1~~GFUD01001743.1.p1  ORF type:complete len:1274 (+),score=352.69 GFUD01001743.1:59-3880(+)
MSLCPPGDDPGTRYGDIRLNQRARKEGGPPTEVFIVTEEMDSLNIRCKVCEMTIFGVRNLNSHIAGKKHQGKFSSKTWELIDDSEPTFSLPEPVSAVSSNTGQAGSSNTGQAGNSAAGKSKLETSGVLDKSKVFHSSDGPVQKLLDGIKEAVIGVEYLVEIREDGYRSNPAVICMLCSKEIECSAVKGHITSATHRLTYLECFFPIVRRKFAKVQNLNFWEGPTFDFLESIVSRIEARLGRLKALTVQGRHFLEMEMEAVRAMVENGSHFKEAVGLNFRTIPDPFGSYLFKIPKHEVVDISLLPDPKGRPGLDLSVQQHQQVVWGGSSGSQGPDVGGVPESSEKSNVLYKIASLRKEITKDEKYVNHMKKLRKDVKDANSKSEKGGDKKIGLDEVSDEELPKERDLKLRRPEKRGIRSRNPDGLSSRRDRDREEKDSAGKGEISRELHMDREEKERERRGREREKEAVSGRKEDHWRDRRRDERHVRRSRSRSRDKRRERSVSPYVVIMEKWNRFKKAEGVMLSNISNRKDIYDKRPEDHPKYGEEWKMFWEKRYKELQAQGKDPNNHDFKAEWIPFWTKRVSQLFDTEVLEKTDDLMKKFELTSVVEPKREDYVKVIKECKSPEKRDRRSPRKERRSSRSPNRKGGARNYSPDDRRTVRDVGYDFDSRQGVSRDGREAEKDRVGHHSIRSPEDRKGRHVDTSPNRRQGFNRNPSPGDRRGGIRNPSPPGTAKASMHEQGRTGLNRPDSNRSDMYSGITELEFKRDRGRSGSPVRLEETKLSRGHEFHSLDDPQMGAVKVLPCLRLLSALEDSLGSLGPQINQVLAKALSLEQSREGASKVLLEDPDTVSILDMVKEKLSGQMAAGLLEGSKEGAVRVCLDNLTRLLQNATKKRSLIPSSLLNIKEPTKAAASNASDNAAAEETAKALIAQSIATVLIMSGKDVISDQELERLVEELMKQTAEEDHNSAVGRFAKSFSESLVLERQLATRSANQFNIYNSPQLNPATIATITVNADQETGDDLDDLTIDELRSLLNSFKNLSKQEQIDLISYMKKLETTNPEKVKQLRAGMRQPERKLEADGEQGGNERDWTPISKRSRRLSGSDLDINPAAPETQGPGGRESKQSEGGWEGEDIEERSLVGSGEQFGANADMGRNWDRRMEYGDHGAPRGGSAAFGIDRNQAGPEDTWSKQFSGPDGGGRFSNQEPHRGGMASFGNQGASFQGERGGGGVGREWQGGRGYNQHYERKEDIPSNQTFGGRGQSGGSGHRGTRW